MRSPDRTPKKRASRRGVTLLEMLVTVTLLLLMMTAIVAIFQSATGSVTESRARALLDQDLRRLNTMIRQDLAGVTAKMTPPNDPGDNRGFFEYGENALSDAQGEDSDDTLRFTAKAPIGRPFTGRVWVPKTMPGSDGRFGTYSTMEPISVTSDYAEIIYFQRGDKLYRRIKLILPTPAKLITDPPSSGVGNVPTDAPTNPPFAPIPNPPGPPNTPNRGGPGRFGFATNLFEPIDLFASSPITTAAGNTVVTTVTANGNTAALVGWNALNDISARPSHYNTDRLTLPQRAEDYTPIHNTLGDLTDRHNRFASPRFSNDFQRFNITSSAWENIPDGLPDDRNGDGVADYYPTMYSNSKIANLLNDSFTPAESATGSAVRPLTVDRVPFPFLYPNAYTVGIQSEYGTIHSLDPNPTVANRTHNHNPIPTGDSLPQPGIPHSWWGFPTWRETSAPTWLDPIKRVNDPAGSSFFTDIIANAGMNEQPYQQTKGLSLQSKYIDGVPHWLPTQLGPYSDGVPGLRSSFDLGGAPVFEDDVVATNVRSFNIKAFDPSPRYFNSTTNQITSLLPGYYDLGYIAGIDPATGLFSAAYASGAATTVTTSATSPLLLDSFGHEGRIPPLVADNRYDAQYPQFSLGDDTASVVRMRRVWDSWSTTYSNAPALPLDPNTGPLSGFAPVIPSYPAPYPSALRGIEIQIRLTDPDDKRIKTMTIRQDFSEKL